VTGNRSRRRFVAAALGALLMAMAVTAGIALRGHSSGLGPRPPGERPALLLLTSLPIVFPEEFTLEGVGSPALTALQGRYRVIPISVADRQSLDRHRLLLMAQPRAQPAEALVELDQWVRGGGRVLLLADPALQWPSKRPLGDALGPPRSYPDTGLLGHWGLRLDSPDNLGPTVIEAAGNRISTAAPGSLVATGRECTVDEARLIARCRIGLGAATVIADADFLDSDRIGTANLDLLLAEMDRLEH
jgi:hypothetical protein